MSLICLHTGSHSPTVGGGNIPLNVTKKEEAQNKEEEIFHAPDQSLSCLSSSVFQTIGG